MKPAAPVTTMRMGIPQTERSRRTDELLVPDLEGEQAEKLAMVAFSAVLMILNHSGEKGRVEVTADRGVLTKERLAHERVERPAKPAVHRGGEAFLGPIDDVAREPALGRAFPNVFSGPTFELQLRGKSLDQTHEIEVEERYPHFNRVRHAHLIAIHQEVIRERQ